MLLSILRLIFGWREIFVTTDQSHYYRVKDILSSHGIKSTTAIENPYKRLLANSRMTSGISYNTYYIYVKKDYLEQGKFLIYQTK